MRHEYNLDKSKINEGHRSAIFNVDGFHFFIEFMIPIGVVLYLYKGLPQHIASISIIWTWRIKDIGYWSHHIVDHTANNELSLTQQFPISGLTLSISKIVDLDTIPLICDIHIANVFDKNGNCIVYQPEDDEKQENELLEVPEAQYYEWKIIPRLKIASKSLSRPISSKIFTLFGFQWYFMLVPRDGHLRIKLYVAYFPSLNVSG